MAKRALPLLTGGLNDVARPDMIDSSQLQECLNYEITGDGILKRRTDQGEFDVDLNTRLSELFSEVLSISEPYYFVTDIDLVNSNDYTLNTDYIILVFGITSENAYEMHTLYKVKLSDGSDYWTNIAQFNSDEEVTLNTLLLNSEIVYTSESDVKFTIADDRIIITDNVNNAHFVTIDIDGFFQASKLGIPAPKNKPRISNLTVWDASLFEEVSTNTRLSQVGLFQCVYTAVTETGDESNPSPLSDTLDMQFFKLDANGAEERWIDNVEITDLSIPDISENDLKSLKYFKVYMRVIRYSAGKELQTLDLTERFEIIDKKNKSGTTGNKYKLTVEVSPGDTASYENDIAPVSKTAASLGGVTMVGNVQTKISFPFDFKYFHKITIDNKDNNNYVDGIVKIRLYDKDSVDSNAIENFTVGDFFTDTGSTKNTNHIRFYDTDLTTPLMVCFGKTIQGSLDVNNYVDLFIKIPLLVASTPHIIYLCWTNQDEMDNYDGVLDSYNDLVHADDSWEGNVGIHYGRFHQTGSDLFSRQQVWNNSRVMDSSCKVVSPQEFAISGQGALNKANSNIYGDLSNVGSSSSLGSSLPQFENFPNLKIGNQSYKTSQYTGEIKYTFNYTDSQSQTAPKINFRKGYFSFTLSFIPSEVYDNQRVAVFSRLEDSINFFGIGLSNQRTDSQLDWVFHVNTSTIDFNTDLSSIILSSSGNHNSNIPTYEIDDELRYSYNVFLSWEIGSGNNDEVKVRFFLYDVSKDFSKDTTNAGITFMETDDMFSEFNTNPMSGVFDECSVFEAISQPTHSDVYIDNILLVNDEFVDDENRVYQLWNFQPMYENIIGYKWTDNSVNNNIDFDETEESKYKSNRNMVKWTDVNGKSFPDLFFKKVREPVVKIMPAPSFLQFEYQNTFIIFTRNSINRFVLQGSASGWSGSSNSLIEEKQQYGLLSEKSLIRAGDALFWLSEVGVVKWDGNQGLQLITKNILNVPIKSSLFGYYVPLNNQYVLHDTSDSISYVYHIDRNAWTKFSGLDVKQSITLTGGSQLENINLYLKENSPSIDSYPTDTYTTSNSNIKTKNMFFEKGTLKRMKSDYTGSDKELQSIVENMNGTEKIHSVNSDSDDWRGVPLGKNRGKSVSFKINNADTISSIMYDLDIESEVKV